MAWPSNSPGSNKVESTTGGYGVRENITEATTSMNTLRDSMYQELNSTQSDISKLMNANGIFKRSDYHDFTMFDIFPRFDPYRWMGTTREYVFVTKPDLHIFKNTTDMGTLNPEIANDPFFSMLMANGYNNTVLANLQFSSGGSSNKPFVPLLTNYMESHLELTSINADDIESGINIYGTKMSYRASSYRSDEFTDFSVEYKDNKYLDCYLWFRAYDQYEKRKSEGKVSPDVNEGQHVYTINKIVTDQMTMFKFIVGEDGETLIHWSCIWGCYPKSVPRDSFSEMPADGQMKFTVQWHGSFQDDMDPLIITHFNWLSDMQAGKTFSYDEIIPLYDTNIQAVTQETALCPYIIRPEKGNGQNIYSPYMQYKLVWRKANH